MRLPDPETLAGLLGIWFLLDALTTYYGLTKAGARELNQFLARLMGQWGVQETLAVTKFVFMFAVWIATVHGVFDGPQVRWLVYMHIGYALLIVWNVYQLLKK